MSFLFPMVLAAAGAAVAPVVIHLILRTKPRKIVFPAMRFVRRTHQANLSKLRLKHLLLLLMRMAMIVLLAVLVARAEVPSWRTVADTSVPAAAVILVDNSGSMGYRHRGRTLLERGKRLAQQVLDALPEGSRVAVLPAVGAPGKVAFQADRRFVSERLASIEPTVGARPLAAGIARALAMLDKIDMERKELYIVTDRTSYSWRDAGPFSAEGVHFIVLDCGPGEDANISLGGIEIGSTTVPEGAKVVLETALRSTSVGGDVDVRVELGGRLVDSRPVTLVPGAGADVRLSFEAAGRGIVHGRVFFDQDDPLAMDNARYFTLEVGPPARVLIVRDPATVGRGAPTSFLMAHAIAPAGTPEGFWVRRRTLTADRLDAAALADVRIVLLCDVSSLSAEQWKALGRFARDGGHVWVVIGSLVSPTSYGSDEARAILPAAPEELEALAQPESFDVRKRGEPTLQPFTTGGNPPLSDVLCRRRFRIAARAEGAEVVLHYADGAPAILRRTVGEGSSVLWTFSPVRGFSNLAGLPQFPILARRTARLLAGGTEADRLVVWGRTAVVPSPRSMPNALATVLRPGAERPEPVVRSLNDRAVSLRADRPGPWTVRFAEGADRIERGFSVNADPVESDMTVFDEKALAAIFPDEKLLLASDPAALAELRRTVRQPLDLAVPILLGLLILAIGESFFANRFYRRQVAPDAPAAPAPSAGSQSE